MKLTGAYIMQAIPPWCGEKRMRVSVVEWRGNHVLLRDEELNAKGIGYLIETDLGSLELDIPQQEDSK